jgi:hypothetical protein
MSEQPPSPAPWPEGVLARYLTVAGATVDLTYTDGQVKATCTGERCPWEHGEQTEIYYFDSDEEKARKINPVLPAAQRQAQAHAEKCRAMPRPEAGQ